MRKVHCTCFERFGRSPVLGQSVPNHVADEKTVAVASLRLVSTSLQQAEW